jgi:hypothetical protein
VAVLRRHLRKPKFGEYHLCAFSRMRCRTVLLRLLTASLQFSPTS